MEEKITLTVTPEEYTAIKKFMAMPDGKCPAHQVFEGPLDYDIFDAKMEYYRKNNEKPITANKLVDSLTNCKASERFYDPTINKYGTVYRGTLPNINKNDDVVVEVTVSIFDDGKLHK